MIEPLENSSRSKNMGSDSHDSWPAVLKRGKTAAIAAILSVMIGVVLTGYRTHREYASREAGFELFHSGLSDFHNGIYYPLLRLARA